MNESEKERLIKKDIASIENRVRHAFNQGYEMGLKESRSEIPNTCGDAISRKAVLDLAEWFDLNQQHFTVANLIDEVENMPSVAPQQRTGRWIPVSERLPEKDDLYLVYFDGEYNLVYFSNGAFSYSGVIAWMPLPEPYKAE